MFNDYFQVKLRKLQVQSKKINDELKRRQAIERQAIAAILPISNHYFL